MYSWPSNPSTELSANWNNATGSSKAQMLSSICPVSLCLAKLEDF